ncbi:trypsin-like serine protease, partial [Candidatus Wolfebacteria bacterium]|nr:trypsin-like serine protease [Candidatus Wolfebacteria bacterium]
ISESLEDIEKELPPELFNTFPFSAPNLGIPDAKIDSRGMVEVGGGSGSIVDPNGIILTNKHVISDPHAEYAVLTNDGKKYKAEILARDPVDDIAILKIDAKKLPAIKLGNSHKINLGEEVIAIGNTLGVFKNTVSKGIISGLSRSITAKTEPDKPITELRGLIQVDAAINPGNSGGPLVNMNGEVIGVNTAIVSGAQNIGFAIPINTAKKDLKDVAEYGRVRRPLLGLRYVSIDDNMKEKMNLPINHGALLTGRGPHHEAIIAGTPADKAGLKIKDIIIECNGEKITKEKTIQDFLEECSVGDILKTKVLRGEKELEIKIELAERK